MRNQQEIPDDYVRIAEYQCPVCLRMHNHNAEILIHKRLRSISKKQAFAGHQLCEEHDKLHKEGFLALVESAGDHGNNSTITPEDATYTGRIVHIKYEVAKMMFDSLNQMSMEQFCATPMAFVDSDVINHMENIANKIEEHDEQSE